jgi:uncharacterized membrane protein
MTVDVQTEIVIRRPVEEVARYAADPANAPAWYVNITSVRWQGEPVVAVGSRMAFTARFLGRDLTYTYKIVDLEPGRRLVMRTAEGPFPMETSYTWTDTGDGCTRMALRNRGEPTGFAAVTAPVMAAAMRRANRKDLELLRDVLERPGPDD